MKTKDVTKEQKSLGLWK